VIFRVDRSQRLMLGNGLVGKYLMGSLAGVWRTTRLLECIAVVGTGKRRYNIQRI